MFQACFELAQPPEGPEGQNSNWSAAAVEKLLAKSPKTTSYSYNWSSSENKNQFYGFTKVKQKKTYLALISIEIAYIAFKQNWLTFTCHVRRENRSYYYEFILVYTF